MRNGALAGARDVGWGAPEAPRPIDAREPNLPPCPVTVPGWKSEIDAPHALGARRNRQDQRRADALTQSAVCSERYRARRDAAEIGVQGNPDVGGAPQVRDAPALLDPAHQPRAPGEP